MEMPISEYQEEPAKSAKVPPGKEGLLKGPASSEPKAADTVLTQLSEAERLGISEHILPRFLLLSKHSPMLPAGLTNSVSAAHSLCDPLSGRTVALLFPSSSFQYREPGHLSCPTGAC